MSSQEIFGVLDLPGRHRRMSERLRRSWRLSGRKHSASVASGIQTDRSLRLRESSGIDARGTRKGDREGCDARGMRPTTSSYSALESSERATVLERLKGALAVLASCAALDPLCARRSDAIETNGRMRRATVRLAIDVLDAGASASPKTTLARLATFIAVLTAVNLPAPSALGAFPWSTSRESKLIDSDAGCQDHSVRRTGKVRLDIHTHRKEFQKGSRNLIAIH
jgi:hypothetical protein